MSIFINLSFYYLIIIIFINILACFILLIIGAILFLTGLALFLSNRKGINVLIDNNNNNNNNNNNLIGVDVLIVGCISKFILFYYYYYYFIKVYFITINQSIVLLPGVYATQILVGTYLGWRGNEFFSNDLKKKLLIIIIGYDYGALPSFE